MGPLVLSRSESATLTLKEAVQAAAVELTETYNTYGVRKFSLVFPIKAHDWLKNGITSDEERYISLRLKAARRLMKGKTENEWGAKKQLVEQSIISATDATLFVYKHTQLDVVAVKTKMFDMEILGVTGQIARLRGRTRTRWQRYRAQR
jgi:hypothetical protein